MKDREDEAGGSADPREALGGSSLRRRSERSGPPAEGRHPRAGTSSLANLSFAERSLLRALLSGQHLRADRTLDGGKECRLHDTRGVPQAVVAADVVERLREAGLVGSNLKFPGASYLLTDAGVRIASRLTDSPLRPLATGSP